MSVGEGGGGAQESDCVVRGRSPSLPRSPPSALPPSHVVVDDDLQVVRALDLRAYGVVPRISVGSTLMTLLSRLFLKSSPASLSAMTWKFGVLLLGCPALGGRGWPGTSHCFSGWPDCRCAVSFVQGSVRITHLLSWFGMFSLVLLLSLKAFFLASNSSLFSVSPDPL